ncbi:MAG: hypothetical protein RL672_1059 [Actinomycetota bacterium]
MNNSRKKAPIHTPSAVPQGEVVEEFGQYAHAVQFVERMVAKGFPTGMIAIVGKDLRSVERVRGKLSYGRIALSGAMTGAWLGVIVGWLFGSAIPGVDSTTGGTGSIISAVVMGAGVGMLWTVIRFSLNRNKRNFMSQSQIVAAVYQVQVPMTLVDEARKAGAVEGSTEA